MSIYLGTTQITDMHLGDSGYGLPDVVKVYLGSSLVWPAGGPSLSLDSYYWAHYNNSPSADPMGTSFTGSGTSASPAVAVIGTNYGALGNQTNLYGDARMWLLVQKSGTLSYSIQVENPGGYNGETQLFKTSLQPAQHIQDLAGTPTGMENIANLSSSGSGSVSVTAGQYLVLRWNQGDGGTKIVRSTYTLSIS